MHVAFERARATLGLADKHDPATRLLTEKVIEAARSGERDAARLYQMALASVRRPPDLTVDQVEQSRKVMAACRKELTRILARKGDDVSLVPRSRDAIDQSHLLLIEADRILTRHRTALAPYAGRRARALS